LPAPITADEVLHILLPAVLPRHPDDGAKIEERVRRAISGLTSDRLRRRQEALWTLDHALSIYTSAPAEVDPAVVERLGDLYRERRLWRPALLAYVHLRSEPKLTALLLDTIAAGEFGVARNTLESIRHARTESDMSDVSAHLNDVDG
jgi:hypothetical protein